MPQNPLSGNVNEAEDGRAVLAGALQRARSCDETASIEPANAATINDNVAVSMSEHSIFQSVVAQLECLQTEVHRTAAAQRAEWAQTARRLQQLHERREAETQEFSRRIETLRAMVTQLLVHQFGDQTVDAGDQHRT